MKKILTACQATSDQLHIGNYFGAIQPLIQQMQNPDLQFRLFVVDMHSITKVLNIKENHPYMQWTRNLIKIYIASGVDLSKTVVFKQSDVPGHAQLERILACYTHIGFMQRMHVYKDALNKNELNKMSIGTMNYPILMAADILIYDTDIVPVGKDNQQHVEYCMDIAEKFNHRYGDIFHIPKREVSAEVGEVPGIDGRKMSKSYNNYIGMLDTPEILRKKINKITTTDLLPEDPKDPDTCNIYQIAKLFLDESEKTDLRLRYTQGGMSYKYAKDLLYDKVIDFLAPIQARYAEIDDAYIDDLLAQNAVIANQVANAKIDQVYKAIGFR